MVSSRPGRERPPGSPVESGARWRQLGEPTLRATVQTATQITTQPTTPTTTQPAVQSSMPADARTLRRSATSTFTGLGVNDFDLRAATAPRRAWHSPAVGIVVEESPAWVIAAAEAAACGDWELGSASAVATIAEEVSDAADAANSINATKRTKVSTAAANATDIDTDADTDTADVRSKRHATPEARRRANIRTAALTALGAGLAIALPAVLRLPNDAHVTLTGPESTGPGLAAPQDSASPAVGGASPQDRAATPHSAASPTSSISTGGAGQPSSTAPGTTGRAVRPATAAVPGAGPTTQVSADLAASFENQVVELTNVQRAAAGCGPLHLDARLQAAAIAHSVDMRARGYFAHDTPDGVTPWTRMADAGYTAPSAENIAMGQATPQDVVTAWMNSPGHRANILSCSSEAIGVGVQFGPGGPWWTQDFGYV